MPIVVFLVVFLVNLGAAQDPDQLAAARVLGPWWKQMARVSGVVFTGTVLSVSASRADANHALPTVEVKFRVEQGITGVQRGQVLSVREWSGAWSSQPAMHQGQRLLLLLYPPSRLGLTSPVGGAMGQVALDASGKNVMAPTLTANDLPSTRTQLRPAKQESVSLAQLERAIRSAREE
jgi:hypothetical protein